MNWSRLVTALAVASMLAPACEELPTEIPRSRRGAIRAIHFVDWTANGYRRSAAEESLVALEKTGAQMVSILVTAYQDAPRSGTPETDRALTPDALAVETAAWLAIDLGMSVAIKPHVDLRNGEWRGNIIPPNPLEWFRAYREFLYEQSDLAESVGAELFMVGTELAGTLEHESEWRETIAGVRERFSGEITYAASWDEAMLVPFWDALDYVGVDFYFPVARRSNPGRLEILHQWQPWLDRLERLRHRAGKPVLLTEIGYRSVDGAGMVPYRFGDDAAVDEEEQADLYWAAIEATADADWIRGIMWWNWLASSGADSDSRDFTPRGKKAENILRESWGSEL